MRLNLKKIFWEITSECDNCCTYCGTRDVSHIINHDSIVRRVLENIIPYLPEEIQIGGGDPLLVDVNTHKFIVDKLRPTTRCEIMINPKSDLKIETVKLYALVYISLNDLEELDAYEIKWKDKIHEENIPHVFVTNFNLLNFFLVEKISKVVKDKLWHIGFTIYGDLNSSLALYRQDVALQKLNSSLSEIAETHNICIENNANCEYCTAGIHSLGLLYDGSVVPCLSMRFWCVVRKEMQGNILYEKLKDIWYKKFEKQRFTDWFCCKNQCKNKIIDIRKQGIVLRELPQQILIGDIGDVIDCVVNYPALERKKD